MIFLAVRRRIGHDAKTGNTHMQKRMTEAEFVDAFDKALAEWRIRPFYQPQINHGTGRMVGAEALMRWTDPEFGMQSPADFIPVLEKHDLLYQADVRMFDAACAFLRQCMDRKLPLVPISVNMSRYDVYRHEYVDEIEALREKYGIPVKYLRIEVTESSAIGGMELMKDVIGCLHKHGYVVEMDDFGSGYSSLNILKDLNVDVIKLDMKFLCGEVSGRGGVILNSVVQMARWLSTPVITEGVETMEQADYMKSLGCNYVQGYLYSRPLDEVAFVEKLKMTELEPLAPAMQFTEAVDAGKFWDPASMETLVFNNLVGPAALFTFRESTEKMEVVRVNKKYLRELGMNMTEQEAISMLSTSHFADDGLKVFVSTIRRAIALGTEETCETWRNVCTKSCGNSKVCLLTDLRAIGSAGDLHLIYSLARNVTREKTLHNELMRSDLRFRAAAEQANVYAWEYEISTHRMRPCFRCMRDLNLPPLLEDYPESAIEAGVFPPETADMYREVMRKIDAGMPEFEAVIPLTVGRIPFHVRYKTEFDENGRPFKAYGSATLVVDGKKA